jgi:1-deoxy-D-xylulose-5-phosphate synthase
VKVLEEAKKINNSIRILNLGFGDHFIPHGKVELLFESNGLDAEGVAQSIKNFVGEKE